MSLSVNDKLLAERISCNTYFRYNSLNSGMLTLSPSNTTLYEGKQTLHLLPY